MAGWLPISSMPSLMAEFNCYQAVVKNANILFIKPSLSQTTVSIGMPANREMPTLISINAMRCFVAFWKRYTGPGIQLLQLAERRG